ncbi:MAG: zf-TFIIB domain-containing protein [Planctomyces sp.]|nr:zf-TFIIB domain-containing protein [Planctomyces sp.]
MSNCRRCGAPQALELKNGRVVCEFCATSSLPLAGSGLLEDIIDLGCEAQTDCPGCGTRLRSGLIEGQAVAWCSDCRGMLFADVAFAAAVRIRRAAFGEYGRAPRPLDPQALERRIACSRCRRPMQVHPYYGPGNVVVDSCYPCGLVWIDAGELVQIEQAPGRR